MTDQLITDGATGDEDFDLEVAADASVLTDEGTGDEEGVVAGGADEASPEGEVAPTAEQQRAKFEQTHDINDLPEADRPFFRRYKTAFNKEMAKQRQMVKDAAEQRERYEALLAQRGAPEKPAAGPPDLGDDIDPKFKDALDARVAYGVDKALERMGVLKRVETAEQAAAKLQQNSFVADVMTDLTKNGMTPEEQAYIERDWAEAEEDGDTSVRESFRTARGRSKLLTRIRAEMSSAQARVTTVQRQANAAGAPISRPGGGTTTPAATDYRKLREEQGMDAVRDRIVDEDKALWESMR